MECLQLRVFEVGDGDLVSLEIPGGECCAVDFYRLEATDGHPLSKRSQNHVRIAFACLTHPHRDHMASTTEMERVLRLVALSGGEFWHTVANMARLIELVQERNVIEVWRSGLLKRDVEHLVKMACVVADSFPADRIRFISAEPGSPRPLLSRNGVEINVLGPSKQDALAYIAMLERVAAGEVTSIDGRTVNCASAVLALRCGDNTVILGGDAPDAVWQEITARGRTGASDPPRVQCVKASHHGSNDSFYDGLWDDLFGEDEGIVLVSANGATRPTLQFLESFSIRKRRGISDRVICTGIIDPERRPEFLDLQYQAVLDHVARPVRHSATVNWGDINVTIPCNSPISVQQRYTTRV